MSTSTYLSLNGEIINENDSVLLNNRGFLFGDGFFESMHWCVKSSGSEKSGSGSLNNGRILFWDDHVERINYAFNLLKLDKSEIDISILMQQINELVAKNNIVGDARVRMTFYRISEGNYTPSKNKTGWMINARPLDIYGFAFNEKGLNIGIFSGQTKSRSSISNLKTLNSLVYVLAGMYARENNWDDILILNDAGNIIEAHTSNIFIVQNNTLYTPPLTDGCVNGVMRKQVIRLAEKAGIDCIEKSLFQNDIDEADEVILSNAVQGIRWVERSGNNIYSKKICNQLFTELKFITK